MAKCKALTGLAVKGLRLCTIRVRDRRLFSGAGWKAIALGPRKSTLTDEMILRVRVTDDRQ